MAFAACDDTHGSADQKSPPDRGHDVAANAEHDMGAAGEPQPGKGENADVLEVALTPAALAGNEVERICRHFLPGAVELRQEVDFPPGPDEQRAFDDVVTQDLAAKWRLAR